MEATTGQEIITRIDKIIGELESLKALVWEVWMVRYSDAQIAETTDSQKDTFVSNAGNTTEP